MATKTWSYKGTTYSTKTAQRASVPKKPVKVTEISKVHVSSTSKKLKTKAKSMVSKATGLKPKR